MSDSNDEKVLTFAEWCAINSFSRATGQRIIAAGGGPNFLKLSERRKGVTVGENRRWQESRTSHSSKKAIDESHILDNAEETQKHILTSISQHLQDITDQNSRIADALQGIESLLHGVVGPSDWKAGKPGFVRTLALVD